MSGKCGEKIILSRKEIMLMKRFFLLETIRVSAMLEITKQEKTISGIYSHLFPSFKEKTIPGETASDRWHRNIKVVVESEDLSHLSEHPLCTLELLKWGYIFNSGYFAIWDCTESGVDFFDFRYRYDIGSGTFKADGRLRTYKNRRAA